MEHIFDEFYKLADHDSQNKYLYWLIKRSVPKQRRPRSGTKVARSNSFQYHVCLSSGIHVKVCKQAFYQIHPIGKHHVKHLCEKLESGVLFSGDEHGKHKH